VREARVAALEARRGTRQASLPARDVAKVATGETGLVVVRQKRRRGWKAMFTDFRVDSTHRFFAVQNVDPVLLEAGPEQRGDCGFRTDRIRKRATTRFV
jgi:hypothetical protein